MCVMTLLPKTVLWVGSRITAICLTCVRLQRLVALLITTCRSELRFSLFQGTRVLTALQLQRCAGLIRKLHYLRKPRASRFHKHKYFFCMAFRLKPALLIKPPKKARSLKWRCPCLDSAIAVYRISITGFKRLKALAAAVLNESSRLTI
jgi:hypothetical protein